MNDLIDTTEMYLKTVYELEEEGVLPLRARIAERLHQSGPTVSQTVARMQRDGLLTVEGDRHLELTDKGRKHAIAVMRKHRLAEILLLEVIGLDWEDVHVEACRWEHVMSEDVERRIVGLVADPHICPHGNPVPGLEELGTDPTAVAGPDLRLLSDLATPDGAKVVIRRISEHLQPDADLMRRFRQVGIQPGASLTATSIGGGGVQVADEKFDDLVATHVFVTTS